MQTFRNSRWLIVALVISSLANLSEIADLRVSTPVSRSVGIRGTVARSIGMLAAERKGAWALSASSPWTQTFTVFGYALHAAVPSLRRLSTLISCGRSPPWQRRNPATREG